MRGTFTLGADAAIAAGPVGRRAEAATDAELKAEIYSYSRTRGLFAGVSLEGSALTIDDRANGSYYGITAPGAPPPPVPPAAQQLVQIIAALASRSPPPGQVVGASATIPPAPLSTAGVSFNSTQAQLASAATNLSAILDDRWRQYLALPAEVFDPARRPSAQAVESTLQRFGATAQNPQYQSLTSRQEFATTYQLLQKLSGELRPSAAAQLALPPPPTTPR
jgi:hypothetical protein